MVKSRIPKKEQLEGFIKGNETSVAENYYSMSEFEAFDKVSGSYWIPAFDVTREEILEYLKANYSLEDLQKNMGSMSIKLKINDGKYIVYSWDYEYEMRKGEIVGYKEWVYDTEDEVYEDFVNGLGAGTGLSFYKPIKTPEPRFEKSKEEVRRERRKKIKAQLTEQKRLREEDK